ncbi:4-(cytidine 5'-diphospho)-2-C-methyl-D-erythritol kinase, partial [Agathobacter rectalis]|uniref:4-(cytidine 5'-diphospho)-2-C-methyl-D-erythritol kinase n=2 Tax=Bacillota TaxID=1239 RepID=UPI0027F47E7C|nr:4-(cytidine 5'-diphospho)-2-C-methyl-D-erythritol kinase [Agathobacter rectalis]
ERFNVKSGVEIYLEKQIPVAAGLAGGSSDAAATLRGLNELWKLNLTLEQLAEIGSEVGSDVPFCVMGGTAIATGRGEK